MPHILHQRQHHKLPLPHPRMRQSQPWRIHPHIIHHNDIDIDSPVHISPRGIPVRSIIYLTLHPLRDLKQLQRVILAHSPHTHTDINKPVGRLEPPRLRLHSLRHRIHPRKLQSQQLHSPIYKRPTVTTVRPDIQKHNHISTAIKIKKQQKQQNNRSRTAKKQENSSIQTHTSSCSPVFISSDKTIALWTYGPKTI